MNNMIAVHNTPIYNLMLDVNIQKINGITVVEMLGELDSVSAPKVQDQILNLAGKESRILLDMSQVTYMSSAGLRILLMLYRSITDNVGKIVLAGLNEEVREVMAITGFLDFFHTVSSRTEAMQVLH